MKALSRGVVRRGELARTKVQRVSTLVLDVKERGLHHALIAGNELRSPATAPQGEADE